MRFLSLLLAACTLSSGAFSESSELLREFLQAVRAFEESLDEAQRDGFQQDFDSEARMDWSYFPGERPGIHLGSLDEAQREKLQAVVKTGLSAAGYEKVESIRSLEEVLGGHYDSGNYYLTLFGTPSESEPWGLRWEGHHVSLNWTMVDGEVIASTPQFLGANPAVVKEGPKVGLQPLKVEQELARSLAQSLTAEQRAKGILSDTAPPEILTRMERQVDILENRGITYSELSEEQQGVLRRLVEEYARVQQPDLAARRLHRVHDAGWDKITFAWMGGLEPGQGHYYRIQGVSFLIEYDNTQNDANHVHSVWRDFEGDFGRDVLKEHYESHRDPETGDHAH